MSHTSVSHKKIRYLLYQFSLLQVKSSVHVDGWISPLLADSLTDTAHSRLDCFTDSIQRWSSCIFCNLWSIFSSVDSFKWSYCGLTSSSVNAHGMLDDEYNFPTDILPLLPPIRKLDKWKSYVAKNHGFVSFGALDEEKIAAPWILNCPPFQYMI